MIVTCIVCPGGISAIDDIATRVRPAKSKNNKLCLVLLQFMHCPVFCLAVTERLHIPLFATADIMD